MMFSHLVRFRWCQQVHESMAVAHRRRRRRRRRRHLLRHHRHLKLRVRAVQWMLVLSHGLAPRQW